MNSEEIEILEDIEARLCDNFHFDIEEAYFNDCQWLFDKVMDRERQLNQLKRLVESM